MIERCRDFRGDLYRQSDGADAAVHLQARLVPAFRSSDGVRRIRLGFDFLVWRQRRLSFGGGGGDAFRSCRDRVSYMWVFRMLWDVTRNVDLCNSGLVIGSRSREPSIKG